MKVLFVHTAHRQGEGADARYSIMAISQGTFALAALAEDAGHDVGIVHLAIEKLLDPRFDLLDLLGREAPDVLALGLHWHHQVLDVLEAAAVARQVRCPYVLLGGLTAGIFHEQLAAHPAVDGVIRGDAEEPLLRLLSALSSAAPALGDVPNLTWRQGDLVQVNPLTHVADQEAVDRLCYTRYRLLRHHELYSGQLAFDPAAGTLAAHTLARRFNLPIARGCARGCPRCGGARQVLGPVTGRDGAVFRRTERVVDTVREAAEQGLTTFYVSCHPADHDPDYYPRLFSQIQQSGVRCAMQIEAFAYLPDETFLEAFAAAFEPRRSMLILSPHGGAARRRRVGIGYSDDALGRCLGRAAELGIRVRCHAGVGPPDSWPDVARAGELALQLRRQRVDVIPLLDEVDPGSPWTGQASEHGIVRPNRELDQIVDGSRRSRGAARGVVHTGYRLEQQQEKFLALQAASRTPGRVQRWLRAGIFPDAAGGVVCVGAGALKLPGPVVSDRRWTALVTGCEGMDQIQDAARGITRLLPGTATLRVVPSLPDFPEATEEAAARTPPALLTDGCRFCAGQCPAPLGRRLFIADDGAWRPCLAAPELTFGVSLAEFKEQHAREVSRQRQLRGCGSCAVVDRCPACVHLASLPAKRYCRLMRVALKRQSKPHS